MGRPRKNASSSQTASKNQHNPTPNQSSAFDFLVSAIAAASNLSQPYQQSYGVQDDQYQSNGQHSRNNGSSRSSTAESSRGRDRRGNSGVGSPLKALVNQNAPPPKDTATSLDQVFGHSSFSKALLTTQPGSSTPNQNNATTTLPTPFYMTLLQNLASNNNLSFGNSFQQENVQATPIQQTRSGRISRPPLPNQNVLKALQILSQPGMEAVRDALGTTGLLEGFNKMAEESQRTEEVNRNNQQENLENAIRAVMGNNASSSNFSHDRNGSGNGQQEESRKRRRKSNTRSPTPPPLDPQFHSLPQQYSGYDDHDDHDSPQHGADGYDGTMQQGGKGKGSRLAMTKEEVLFRRRERNKASALASRTKVKDRIGELEVLLRDKEREVEEVRAQCGRMEKEIEALKQIIVSSGLDVETLQRTLMATLPNQTFHSTTHIPSQSQYQEVGGNAFDLHPPMMNIQSSSSSTPQQNPNQSFADPSQTYLPPISLRPQISTIPSIPPETLPQLPSQQSSMPHQFDSRLDPIDSIGTNPQSLGVPTPFTDATFTPDTTFNGEPIFDFNMFMNMEQMDDELDGDFEPETSPHHGSERSDSDNEDNDDHDQDNENTDENEMRGTPEGNHAQKTITHLGTETTPGQQYETPMDGDGEDEFIDPEMEDEDLFLPIEDVPIPPEVIHDLTGDMMKALKVDTRDQLAAVMQKLVDSAGEGGVGSEVVEKLKSVIYLAQAQERR